MNNTLWKNIIRDIKNSKARFVSIMLIVALGVGFFTGLKATAPSMNKTAEEYYAAQNLMDFRILSTVGFSQSDANALLELDHVRAVQVSYFADVIAEVSGESDVIRMYSVPQQDERGTTINELVVKEGRLPQSSGEIAVEQANFSGDYSIGDIITVESEISGEDTLDTLNTLEYTIVGFVQTPLYVSYERGSTTVADGSVDLYAYICEEDFVSERYTQMYVLTDYSDGSIETLSDEYDSYIEEMTSVLEEVGVQRAGLFDSEYLAEAKQELLDAQEELDSETEKAQQELDDALLELNKAQDEYDTQVAQGQQELDDAAAQIEDGKQELEDGWEAYYSAISSAQEQLDSAKAQLDSAQDTLDAQEDEFNSQIRSAERELAAAQREYEQGLADYEDAVSELDSQTLTARLAIDALKVKYELSLNVYENTTKPAAEKAISAAQANIADAQSTIAELQARYESATDAEKITIQLRIDAQNVIISANQAEIDSQTERLEQSAATVSENLEAYETAQAELDASTADAQAQLDAAKEQLDSASAQLAEGSDTLASEKAAGEAALSSAQQEINNGQSERTAGISALTSEKAAGKSELEQAEQELENAQEYYDSGLTEFEQQTAEAKRQLDDAWQEYYDAKEEAEATIADAQSEIDKAQRQLDELEDPEWYVYNRKDNPGFESLIDDTTRVDAVATVFPLFFLLVAALVCLTTMTRIVEEKRTEIGTLKALGYAGGAIRMKFVVYATTAAALGCAIGITAGMLTLPYIIYNAYGIMYELQSLTLVMPWSIAIGGVCAGFACTTAVALYTCGMALRERPASLMRPKAPKIGRKIILERIPFVWNHMNFTSKVTARNILRYKARFLMTVVGVAGCTALMLAGFGLKNSISGITDKQFGEIQTYDMLAVLSGDGTFHQKQDVLDFMLEQDEVSSAVLELQTAITVDNTGGGSEQSDVYLLVPSSIEDMRDFIHLRERESGDTLELTDEGVVITEKLADNLGVGEGDSIVITDDNRDYTLTVTGVCENYLYGYVYMSPDYYEEIYGTQTRCNMLMVSMSDTSDGAESKLGTKCLDNEGITAVSFISGSIESFADTVESLDAVVLLLIVCAGLLAVVVLYNLTNINIAQRQREIATIKVLGFYDSETSAYVYRENIVLTVCGIIVGLALGIILHRFVILTIEVSKTMFCRDIAWWSYAAAAALTAVFAALVNVIMYGKIKAIDMVESLKSVE